ncbi:MAG TPA: aminopeptidase P family protein, partial [Proteobacteria bacterium]|nr:aminopeptidase P family protein [Pseudomonadota bacterium]
MPRHSDRLDQLHRLLESAHYDAFLISHPANLSYYTGYSGDSAYLLIGAKRSCFFTDGRYTTQAADEIPGEIDLIRINSVADLCRHLRSENLIRKLGVDETKMNLGDWLKLREHLDGREPEPAAALINLPRLCKSEDEIERLSKAVKVSETALQNTLSRLETGISEHELALELEYQMRRAGAERTAFPLIIASGPRSALPHGLASPRRLTPGDIVTIDFGACLQGYHSDQTCTYFLSEPEPEVKQVYNALYEAQHQGLQALKGKLLPSPRELDRTVRKVLLDSGLGEYFSHGTGHGIGLEIHEAPSISPNSTSETLEIGMVFTIE